MAAAHVKARQPEYLGGAKRFPVPDDRVAWEVEWEDYSPVDYTAPPVLKAPVWADPDIKYVRRACVCMHVSMYLCMYIELVQLIHH